MSTQQELIDELLLCSVGQEKEVLKKNKHLLDNDFLLLCKEVAQKESNSYVKNLMNKIYELSMEVGIN